MVFAELWKDEGMRGMFKGVVARMWYMGANSLCVITAYEVRFGPCGVCFCLAI